MIFDLYGVLLFLKIGVFFFMLVELGILWVYIVLLFMFIVIMVEVNFIFL